MLLEVWRGAALTEGEGPLSSPARSFLSLVSLSCSVSTTVFIHWNTCRCFCPFASSFFIKQLPESGLLIAGCPPTCLAHVESVRTEFVLISMQESLPSFSLIPVPWKSCVVTTVLQGVSSIFTKHVLCLMMLHYVKICFIFTKHIYILL